MQVGVLDDTDEFADLLTLKPNDTLTIFTNQEVINKVVEPRNINNPWQI